MIFIDGEEDDQTAPTFINPKDVNIMSPDYRASQAGSTTHSAPYTAEKAVDGDTTTRWATTNYDFVPAVLTVTFKGTVRFNEIYIKEFADRVGSFTLEYQDSNNVWQPFHTGATLGSASDKDVYISNFGNIDAKSIKATFNKKSQDTLGISICELQAKYK